MTSSSENTLYQRLGGYDAIAAAVDDLMPRLFDDPQIGVHRKGQSVATKMRGRQMILAMEAITRTPAIT